MKVGERVMLRDPAEILATLDENGLVDGVPFMPEMLGYFGQTAKIEANLDRVCDTVNPVAVRKIPNAFALDELRCDGSAHAGCQAQCRLFWKESWLRPAEGAVSAPDPEALARLEELVVASAQTAESTAEEPIYRCQATELTRESEPVGYWNPGSFLGQLTSRNVGVWHFVRVMVRVISSEIARRLHIISRYPVLPKNPPGFTYEVPPPRGLKVGELVRVRSREEIAKTLNDEGRHRGLWFDHEMLPYCGKTARVRTKVERFVDEKTGKIVNLKSDCYILEGCICVSDDSDGRWFCPRAIFIWWREAWLEPIERSQ